MFPHSIARMVYPPSKIIHNPKLCLFYGLESVDKNLHVNRKLRFHHLIAQSVGKKKSNFGFLQCLKPLPSCTQQYVKRSRTKPKDNKHPGLAIYSSHGTAVGTGNQCSFYIHQVKQPRLRPGLSSSSYCKWSRKDQLF